MRLAVIPARGGSKRIPRKNIRLFNGKPIIAWSIIAAQESRCFDEIIVSTDDPEISAVAESYGAHVPFIRPAELADDHTGTIPVIEHSIQWYISKNTPPKEVCCIYATAPFICPSDLQSGLNLLQNSKADYVLSVTSYAFPVQRALRLSAQDSVQMFSPEFFNSRSQDLEESWHDAGQFYWGTTRSWLNRTPFFSANSLAIRLPRYRVQDIDTLEDWAYAELMLEAMSFMDKK